MKFRSNFLALITAALAAVSAFVTADAQIINPAKPATGVPVAGTGINVVGQTVSVVYGTTSGTSLQGNAVLGLANGGTGQTTLNVHSVLLGNGTSAINTTSPISAGYLLTSNGPAADPTFQSPNSLFASPPPIGSSAPSTGAFTGLSASGTVSGTGFSNYIANAPIEQTVANVAALRTTSCVPGNVYHTQGNSTIADGGAGDYVCNGSDTASTDNGCNIIAAANSYRFYLQYTQGITVRQCGATGNGTTDDTTAIQKAINFVESTYTQGTSNSPYSGTAKLYFPPGYYKVTAALNITSKIYIEGEGQPEFSTGARIFQATANTDLFLIKPVAATASASFAIEKLTLFTTAGTGTGNLINVQNNGSLYFNSWRVLHCVFQSPQNMSIFATGDDVEIASNVFDVSGNSGNAIQLGSNTAGQTATDVRIHNNNFFNVVVHSILAYNTYNVVVSDNLVSQPNSTTYSTAFFDGLDSSPTLVQGVTLSGNLLYGVQRVFGVSGGSEIAVTGNNCYNCGTGSGNAYDAIVLSGTVNDVNIVGNIVNGAYGAKAAFNSMGTSTNIIIQGNSFTSAGGTGTGIIAGGMSGNVSGNRINGFTTPITASDYYAIGYLTLPLQLPTYGSTVTINAAAGGNVLILATNTSAFTIAAPTNPSNGQQLNVTVYNNSGGSLGTVTWNAIFHMNAFVAPPNGDSYTISFVYSSGLGHWYEISRTNSAVPG